MLASVPDHRRPEGKRYPLASLLLIAVAAFLSGRRDQLGVVRWGKRLSREALASIGIDLDEIARRVEDESKPTVLTYGHGDVIRGLEGQWRAGRTPWELKQEDTRYYGRGSADNKPGFFSRPSRVNKI
jgi:acetylornithine deacetylase/succinyl-diaminopimelate desuccinylase-like protein